MKKSTILFVIAVITLTTHAYPPTFLDEYPCEQPSRQAEYNNADASKMPQVMDSFYSSLKYIMKNLRNSLYFVPQIIIDSFLPVDHHKDELATVRYTEVDEMCSAEKAFIEKRSPVVKEAVEKLVHKDIPENNVPKIGMCFSGGGFRAMILTLGFLQAAQETGLLDATMYMTGLSGSTWALAPWIASKKDLNTYIHELSTKISGGLDHIDDPNELIHLLRIIVGKLLTKQFISAMDVYGAVLANTLLKDLGSNRFYATISDTHAYLDDGRLPLPIYTAVATMDGPYEWMEFTPYEVGNLACQSYIPLWAYGRKFRKCISVNTKSEQTLGYYMGIFGSAFEVSIEDILHRTTYNLTNILSYLPAFLAGPVEETIKLLLDSPVGSFRLFPSILPNFTFGCSQDTLFEDVKKLCLVDAGIDCNLPLPPLLRAARNLDIIMVYDGSSTLNGAHELRLAEKYAREHNLKFPEIHYAEILEKPISVFKDDNDPSVPVIIYFPRINNVLYSSSFNPDICVEDDYCNTFNFVYSHANIAELSGLAAFAVTQHQELLTSVLNEVVEKKYA